MRLGALLALALGSTPTAHAGPVTHYVAACRGGSVFYLGDSASLTVGEAKENAREVCVDSGGYRGLYSREAPRRDGPAVLAEVEAAYAKLLWKGHKSEYDAQLKSVAHAEIERARAAEIERAQEVARRSVEIERARAAEAAEIERAQEVARRPALPYDCLAGVCLGGRALADGFVTVAQHIMFRQSEVCSGVVAAVDVSADFSYYPQNEYEQVLLDLLALGWGGERRELGYALQHPHKQGLRLIGIVETDYGWVLVIGTLHPDRDAICAAKRREGL